MTTRSLDTSNNPQGTRERLLQAGLELFGKSGLDGVTTRALAESARVNLNTIPYHFGGKEGMYLAVAQYIVDTTGAAISATAREKAMNLETVSPEQATLLAGELIVSVLRNVLGAPDAAFRGGFILREQLQPTAAFEVLYRGFIRELHESLSALVARATGRDPSELISITRAHALLGQGLVFGMAHETFIRRSGLASADSKALETVIADVQALTVAAIEKVERKNYHEASR